MKYLSLCSVILCLGAGAAVGASFDPMQVTPARATARGVDTARLMQPLARVQSPQPQDGQITPQSLARALADLELYLTLTEGLPGAKSSRDRDAAKMAAEYLRNLLKLN